ncbi:MAG TPA: transglutaminase-like domain-containing protein, partial [Phycisphaerales bacterium]|nr:transglutaminase-like domain-containing protein [Phycisphaerales bacterium]
DGEGNPVIQRAMLGGLSVEFVLAGPEVVTQATAAPELMVSTFVKPDRKIADPRRSTRSVYVLDFVTGPPPPIPQTGSQSVTSIDGTKATISIDVTTPHPAPEEDLDDPAYRDPSGVVSSRDPGVVEIAARAVKDIPADDARRRAEALKRAVDRHITKKSLDVGFAGAAEVARNREGDCSEHAVLLAATLRSVGIPSRIAGGLVYVDEFAGARDCFGYHMWTQALIDVGGSSRWIDLDATMSANSGFDATHVALTVSPLADDRGMLDLLGIAQAMGRLAISVHSVEYER